jgi:GT2 family glycosyltransferase
VRIDRTRDDRACADNGPGTDLDAAHHAGVRADRRALPHERRDDLPLASRPWVPIIGEDGARSYEHLVLESHAVVDRDVVLDLHAVADSRADVDVHIGAERAVGADDRTIADVRVMPDTCAFADPGTRLDDGTVVREVRDGVVQRRVQYDPSAAAPERAAGKRQGTDRSAQQRIMTLPEQRPRVRVVTVNYGGGSLTLDCIEQLRATDWPRDRLELVLVDNASHDGVVGEVKQRWPDVHVVESTFNRGFAGGTNLGIGALDGIDYVALVNNDVFVRPDWLAPLVEVLEDDAEVGAACPKILFATPFLELELTASTARRGRGDWRDLGARVRGVEIDGHDVTAGIQWWRGFWGPEPDLESPNATQWSTDNAVLRVPVHDAPPDVVRICLVGQRPGTIVLRAGGEPVDAELTTTPTWYEVSVGRAPVEVINNTGSVLTPSGHGADRGWLEPDDGRYDEPADVFAWCGATVVLSTRYLADVGRFDERLFLYYEDLDLSWRGRERGWRYRYVPASVVRHVHAATAGEHSSLARYQNERNHLLVLARHASPGATLRAAGSSLLVTASYARRDVVSPMLRGERPTPEIVRDRARALASFVRLLPAMTRERRRSRE